MNEYQTYAALRAATTLPAPTAYVMSRSVAKDGGEGVFIYDSTDTTSADNGATLLVDAAGRRWRRAAEDRAYVEWWGLAFDGTTDAAPAITSAIAYVSGQGGGMVGFKRSFAHPIKSSILMAKGVRLTGLGPAPENDTAAPLMRRLTLRLAANGLSAMITQASLSNALHSIEIDNLILDGAKASFTCPNLIDLSAINSAIRDNYVVNGSGAGLKFRANSVAAWINWIEDNTFGGFGTYGVDFEGSDSWICGNYLSGSAVNLQIKSHGSTTVANNQIEVATQAGLRLEGADGGGHLGVVLTGNRFNQNAIHVVLANGGVTNNGGAVFSGNWFHVSTSYAVQVESNIRNQTFVGNRFENSSSIHFDSASTNTGWTMLGNSFDVAFSAMFNALPADIQISGAGDAGNFLKVPQAIFSDTNDVRTADAVVNVFGNRSVLGVSNAQQRWALARNSSGFDASLVAATPNGNSVALFGQNGETTTVAGFALGLNGSADINITASAISLAKSLKLVPATVATLNASGGGDGSLAYATNGRKTGEASGAGTGVVVYRSASKWRTLYNDAEVLA